MIHPDSRSLEWIEKVAKENHVKDIALAEKAIRAFSLLEALVRSGCPLLFKFKKSNTEAFFYWNEIQLLG